MGVSALDAKVVKIEAMVNSTNQICCLSLACSSGSVLLLKAKAHKSQAEFRHVSAALSITSW